MGRYTVSSGGGTVNALTKSRVVQLHHGPLWDHRLMGGQVPCKD